MIPFLQILLLIYAPVVFPCECHYVTKKLKLYTRNLFTVTRGNTFIVDRGFLIPLVLPSPLFTNFVQPLTLSPPIFTPNALFVALLLWLNGRLYHMSCFFYLIILWIETCGALEGLCCLFHATRCQV